MSAKKITETKILDTRSSQAAQEEIRSLAYSIWESEGHPQGMEMTHWLAAEMQIQQKSAPGAKVRTKAA